MRPRRAGDCAHRPGTTRGRSTRSCGVRARRRRRTGSRTGTAGSRDRARAGTAAGATTPVGPSRRAWPQRGRPQPRAGEHEQRAARTRTDGAGATSTGGSRVMRAHGTRPHRAAATRAREPSGTVGRPALEVFVVQPATAPSRDSSFGRLFAALARQRRACDPGQARAGAPRARVPARRGPPPHRGRPRRRQDVAGQGDRRARSAAPGTASSSPPTCCPSDVTGVSVWNRAADEFEFRPGGVFANVVLADEINRASPKTQSALLEAMEERQVTVDAHTYPLAAPVHGHRHPEPDRARGHLSRCPRPSSTASSCASPIGYPDRDAEARDPRVAGRAHASRRRAHARS